MSTKPGSTAEGRPPAPAPALLHERGVFCNRTLNLRSIRTIGYDMDYTLVHYREDEWERRAYEHTRKKLLDRGWPVGGLRFDPDSVSRGLALDLELGNLVKANRFGYVIRAAHGTRLLDFDELRRVYARTMVDLAEDRFEFLNTLFSLSESCLFGQLVDLYDSEGLPGMHSYAALYREVRSSLDEAHMEGTLKKEMLADPDRFVVLDEDVPLTLLDQKEAGKKLLLITNSEWEYARAIMSYAMDRFLPSGTTWRDLFDVVIVSARKPSFFGPGSPLYEIVDEERGFLQPVIGGLRQGGIFHGGSALAVERHLGLAGDDVLYVGDHLFADVRVSKAVLRWRTALILRELEDEMREVVRFQEKQPALHALMEEKAALEQEMCQLRLRSQRVRRKYGPADDTRVPDLDRRFSALREQAVALDERIAPLARASSEIGSRIWGPLMRAGNDKSLFARQVERYADVYTSRVSNFLQATPFAFLRAPRMTLPHDPS
ncbi:MAG: HAD-IG family 5'-nucleotidase [Candidatus Eiseniibacteriota bacterium]